MGAVTTQRVELKSCPIRSPSWVRGMIPRPYVVRSLLGPFLGHQLGILVLIVRRFVPNKVVCVMMCSREIDLP